MSRLRRVAKPKPGSQMLVEAEELVYDYDNNTISAVGNVKIYYIGYTLEADRVTYIKSNGKLIATGNVKMTDPSGLVVYANDIDITEDFRDGFVDSLRVETPDKTYFAADQRAARRAASGRRSSTASTPPASLARTIRSGRRSGRSRRKRIIVDDKEKMIYFHNASFEFYGLPLAWVPYFSDRRPVGEAQERLPRAGVRLFRRSRLVGGDALFHRARAELRRHPDAGATTPSRASSARSSGGSGLRTASSPCAWPASTSRTRRTS